MVDGGSIITYGSVDGNITINGAMTGPIIDVVSTTGIVNFSGSVQGGGITTFGSLNGNITITGAVDGPIVTGGSSGVTLAGPGQIAGGAITTYGSVIGNITFGGALVAPAIIGGNAGKVTVSVPPRGGSIVTGGSTTGNISIGGALSGHQNDAPDATVIDAIFSQGMSSPLSASDLFDHASLLDLENLVQILTNLTSLTVKNGKPRN